MATVITPQQKLGIGVMRALQWAPYFGACLRGLLRRPFDEATESLMRAADRTPTLAVTATGIMYWSPAYVQKLSVDELALGLMHETMHVLLHHFARSTKIGVTNETAYQANLAQDACINEELRKNWPKLGKDLIYPETLGQPNGLIWEERYRLLLKEKKEKQQGQGQGQGQGQAPGVGSGDCGSCAAGKTLPGEKAGEKGESGGRSEAAMDRMRREVAQAVQEHVAKKGRGTVPSSLERWADDILTPPKIDWRVKLGQCVRGAVASRPGVNAHTWTKISRRQAGVGFGVGRPVIPATHSPQPKVGCVIDTSGSMSKAALTAAMAEGAGVIQAVGGQVTFAVVDAVLHACKPVKTIGEAVALLTGGGGTSMIPGFEALTEQKVDVAVVMTDGFIGNPGPEPAYRVVWVIIEGDAGFSPPFGEVVFVDKGDVA